MPSELAPKKIRCVRITWRPRDQLKTCDHVSRCIVILSCAFVRNWLLAWPFLAVQRSTFTIQCPVIACRRNPSCLELITFSVSVCLADNDNSIPRARARHTTLEVPENNLWGTLTRFPINPNLISIPLFEALFFRARRLRRPVFLTYTTLSQAEDISSPLLIASHEDTLPSASTGSCHTCHSEYK